MKKYLWFLLMPLMCNGATTIKLYTDYPNSTPVSSDFMLFQRGGTYVNSAQSQFLPVWFTDPTFTGTVTITGNTTIGGQLTVGGAVITGVTYYGDGSGLSNVSQQVYFKNLNDNGTNESFWGTTFFEELDVNLAYLTNTFVFITNAPFLKTDGNGQVVIGVELPGTNVLLSAGDNITFTTNVDGTIVIASSSTNTVSTITNNLFVTTNVIIYSNLTVLENIYASTNFSTNFYSTTSYITNLYVDISYITNLYVSQGFITNLYASTNFSTNLYFVSGKGNTLIVTNLYVSSGGTLINTNTANNSAVITDSDHAYTNAVNAHGVFTNSATGPPSFGLLQPTELANVGTAGTYTKTTFNANGLETSGSSAVLASSDFANQGTTTTLLHGNAAGNPSWTQVTANDITAGATPILNLSSSTNLIYRYNTNALTAITMTFGNAYTTNVQGANITFTAVNAQDLAALETVCLFATNSGGTDRTITLPNGIGGPGLGAPPVITVTNKQSCWIYVQHYGNQATNCWFIPTY